MISTYNTFQSMQYWLAILKTKQCLVEDGANASRLLNFFWGDKWTFFYVIRHLIFQYHQLKRLFSNTLELSLQSESFLRIWWHLLGKSLIENFIFCAMNYMCNNVCTWFPEAWSEPCQTSKIDDTIRFYARGTPTKKNFSGIYKWQQCLYIIP